MSYPYILTEGSITLIINGKSVTVNRDNGEFVSLMTALKAGEWEEVRRLSDKATTINEFGKGRINVRAGQVYFGNEILQGYAVDKVLSFIAEGLDAEPLLNFLDKIMDNPSKHCIDQLYGFLAHGNMPIDPDGDFYAYKAVRNNWMDKHSGTIKNDIGAVVEIPRRAVDDNHGVDCSYGLHAGSIEYVRGFAGGADDRILIVKINPKDVVTVPSYDTRKLRCCRYEVVALYDGILPQNTYEHNDYTDEPDFDDEDYDYEEDEDYNEDDNDEYNVCPEGWEGMCKMISSQADVDSICDGCPYWD
jgi:hypothetical protein